MNDVGGTAFLPDGYASESWADWELKAKSRSGVLFKLWLTPYEHAVTDDTVAAFAEVYAEGLTREGIQGVEVAETAIQERGGRRVGVVTLALKVGGGTGVATYAFTPSQGQTVHLRTIAGSRLARQSEADLDQLLDTLELDEEALGAPGGPVSTDAGFATTLPDGWRAPVGKELDPVRKITGKVGEAELSPDRCWAAIRPVVGHDPDVMFACETSLQVGVLDEYSFAGIEAELHDRFFGRAATPVPVGVPVELSDRTGVLFEPPVAGGPVRLAVVPFEGATVQAWALADQLDAAGLDAAFRSAMGATTFSGPDGGAHVVGMDKRVAYLIQHRPTSPMVLVPGLALLGLVGAGVAAARRRKPSYEDLD